ncbi:hypothetical protein [Streptomyces caatingaensis]|uniref:Uncharacterized protein n=1 Tax=Streptomyces caatingaensis TaxID=1678637 RepID=A0A0K9X8M9_9ACTN|nr:hypothetical protein [Streptomyces caatingaensis]KNB49779.1 hypothetical protein AC230_23675 [Streptomyces caatingaensis]
MGLVLFPGDGDMNSPDVSWSYSDFGAFRRWLAQAEGVNLAEMYGFGGERPWNSVSTTLQPFLDHRDDGGPNLTPAQCAAMLPCLEAIVGQEQQGDRDPALGRRFDEARQLIVVMRLCLDKNVQLIFG